MADKTTDTILLLTDREKVRERPGMYIGDNDKLGLGTIVREVIDNAVDEYPNYEDKTKPIEITLHSDNSITVRDYGRGISPYESKKNKGQIEERIAYTRIGAGGKFKNNREQNNNRFAGGLNGTGSAATNFMSEYFDVTIWKDGREFHDRFEDGGIPVVALKNGKLPSKPQKGEKQTGTQITFKADSKVMRVIKVDSNHLETLFQQTAYLNPGLKILFKNERDGDEEFETYHSENGLLDYMESLIIDDEGKSVPMLIKPFIISGEATADVLGDDVDMAANIAIGFSKDDSFAAEAFTNGIYNVSGGTHMRGFFTGLLRLIRHYYQEFQTEINAKHRKKIDLITKVNDTPDIMKLVKTRDLMHQTYVIIDFKHTNPMLTPQTKDTLSSPEAKTATDNIVYDKGMLYLDRNVAAVQTMIGHIIEGLYEKAKDDDAKVKIDKADAKKFISTKLAAARYVGSGKGAEILLVEGDSAAGTIKSRRDANFQSILPLRGKVLNVQKATAAKALANAEIATMISVFNAGYGKAYDDASLDYDKVIICTDADTDGDHIDVLLQTFFKKFMPGLITNGHLYRLVSPLFVNVMKGKKADVMTYTAEEQAEFLEKHRKDVVEIQRKKGLGELTDNQVDDTILNPKTRRLIRIVINDEDEADSLVDSLMGDNVQGRRKLFIEGA